jgi:hypothetical protein
MRICPAIALLSVSLAAPAAKSPAPPPAEQSRVLEAARRTALDYSKALPDFICSEVISRYSDASGKGKDWSAVDSLMLLLNYFGRQEHYRLVQFNHQPDNQPYNSLRGATSQGEFGTMLRRVFEPSCAAAFLWRGRENLRQRSVQVYSYQVARANSTLSLTYVNGSDSGEMVAGYHGLIYIDPTAGATLRVTLEADGLKDFQVSLAGTTLDYDYAMIGGHAYLLPLRAETLMRAGESMTKNVVDFLSYQKFDAGANVRFPEAGEPLDKLR